MSQASQVSYDKMGFEKTACSRCGGTGHYSYCQAYGTVCFKCGGNGKVHTKRGWSALVFFRESLEMPVKDLKVGMIHRKRPDCQWFKVLTVEKDKLNDGCIQYSTNGCIYGIPDSGKVTALVGIKEYTVKLIESIRYQSRLTKAGKEMKKYLK